MLKQKRRKKEGKMFKKSCEKNKRNIEEKIDRNIKKKV